MRKKPHIDTQLVAILAALIVGGGLIFASAAFGLLARGSLSMSSVFFSHLVLGIGVGLVFMTTFTFLDYRLWRQYAPYLFALAVLLTAAVFLPHVGLSHGGGRRWLVLGPLSLQPSEGLKIASIVLASAYFAGIKNKVTTFTWGFGGLAGVLLLPVTILVLQPDIGTLGVITISVCAIFFAAGAPWKQMLAVAATGIIALTLLATIKPYIRDRIVTFIDPSVGQSTQSYQIKQSLIAVGSGGVFGKGFGQGMQKFTYLPEPMGDSIFAVAAEELGFIGAIVIIMLFVMFALRGYSIAAHAPDMFGSLLAVGISTYLAAEAFINIAAMLGVAPLTGIPLTFMSQGGSAMLASLASAGILLSVSRRRRV